MYNRYLYDDRDAFKDLYTYVTDDPVEDSPAMSAVNEPAPPAAPVSAAPASCGVNNHMLGGFNFKNILSRFKLDDFGIIPILILAFLVFDADDDEKLIILALAFLIGL